MEGEPQFKDNSRLSAWKTCPRVNFFHYEKNLVPIGEKLALDMGTCWHSGEDALWIAFFEKGIRGRDLSSIAIKAFNLKWAELGHPIDISIGDIARYLPRTPGVAAEMFHNYVIKRTPWMETLELIAVEKPFAVPIDPEDPTKFYVGRLDKVIKEGAKYWAIEHKTTSMFKAPKDGNPGGIQRSVTDSFDINSQIDGYSFAMRMLYGAKAIGVYVDLALVHKEHHNIFSLIPIPKSLGMANEWLEDTLYWWEKMDEAKITGHYPKNAPGSCRTIYGDCDYRHLCLSTIRLSDLKGIPLGYKEDKWEPFSFEELRKAIQEGKEGAVTLP